MKNFFLRLFLALVSPLIAKNPKRNRILVVTTTALGDTLWATPALENIRKTFPDAFVGVLTSPVGMEVLKNNPWVDQRYLLKKPFALWKMLRKERFDTVLLFHASQRWVLPLCSLIGASRVIGTAGINKGLDDLLTESCSSGPQHEIVRRLKIGEKIGVKNECETLSFFLADGERLPTRATTLQVVMHPGSKDGFKRLPIETFAEVARKLQEKVPCEILITGNPEEKALMEQFVRLAPGVKLCETQSLRSFAALLEQTDLLICNDTGPVHLACALKRPVVAVYSSTDPRLCGPHKAQNAIALFKRPTCAPCLKRKCLSPFCFLQFGADEIVASALKLL